MTNDPNPQADAGAKLAEMSEAQMRDATVPTCDSVDDLRSYIETLTTRSHDYGTCVYAMSMAATAAFNYVARQLGVTGFQAGCADMDILRRTRRIDGPFMVVEIGNALYPQYDLPGRVAEAIEESREWLAEQARERLAENHEFVSPAVVAHWEKLAAESHARALIGATAQEKQA